MNSIAQSIANFLKDHEPFNYLTYEELISVSSSIKVLNLEKNKALFKIDDKLHDCFYVVASGVVNLTFVADAEETLLNKCYPGDIFGLRPFFAKNNYMMTAKAREDCIIYAVPINVFKPFVSLNSSVLDFLLESFAANTKNSFDKENRNSLVTDSIYGEHTSGEIQYFQTLICISDA